MKFLKKSLALLLVLCMLLSFVPMNVFAEEAGGVRVPKDDFKSILYLDMARKYYSPDIVKNFIDDMVTNGFNTLILYLSDNQGFRFWLDKSPTQSITVGGVEYPFFVDNDRDVNTVDDTNTQGIVNPGIVTGWQNVNGADYRPSREYQDGQKWCWNEADMEGVLAYAKQRGIEVVPALNMPGHMGAMLSNVPEEWHNLISGTRSKSSMNVDNADAVEYVHQIVKLYADWFKAHGCERMGIGGDEYGSDVVGGQWRNSADFTKLAAFMNGCGDIVVDAGLIPMAFADLCKGGMNTYFEILNWENDPADTLNKYSKVYNTNENMYFTVRADVNDTGSYEAPGTFTSRTASGIPASAAKMDGVCVAIWGDYGYFDSEPFGGDHGLTVYNATKQGLRNISDDMVKKGYAVEKSELDINLNAGETAAQPVFTLEGEFTEAQLAEKYSDLNTAVVKPIVTAFEEGKPAELITPGTPAIPAKDPVVGTEAQTAITSGNQYVISDGNGNYLVNNGGTLSNTKNPAEATAWTITAADGGYQISVGQSWLVINNETKALTAQNWAGTIANFDTDGFSSNGYYVVFKDGEWKTAQKKSAGGVTEYAPATVYEVGTVVTYNGHYYECIAKDWWSAAAPTDTTKWKDLGTENPFGSGGDTPALEGTAKLYTYTPGEPEVPGTEDVWSEAVPAKTTVSFQAVATGDTQMVVNGVTYKFHVLGEACNHEGYEHQTGVGAYPATCTKQGYTGDTVCSNCNAVLVKGTYTEIDPNNHTLSTDTHGGKDATCSEDGKTGTHYCTQCGIDLPQEGDNAVIPATGEHSYTIPATCQHKARCQYCNEEDPNGALDPNNHEGELVLDQSTVIVAAPGVQGYTGTSKWSCCGAEVKGQYYDYNPIDKEFDKTIELQTYGNAEKDEQEYLNEKPVINPESGNVLDSAGNVLATYTVTYGESKKDPDTIEYTQMTADTLVTGTYKVAVAADNGTYTYLTITDNALATTTDHTAATDWTVTKLADGTYTISNGTYYICHGAAVADGVKLAAGDGSSEVWNYGVISQSFIGFYIPLNPGWGETLYNYGIMSNLALSQAWNSTAAAYIVEDVIGDTHYPVTVEFTPEGIIGTGTLQIGNTLYTVNVKEPPFFEGKELKIDLYQTNEQCWTLNADGTMPEPGTTQNNTTVTPDMKGWDEITGEEEFMSSEKGIRITSISQVRNEDGTYTHPNDGFPYYSMVDTKALAAVAWGSIMDEGKTQIDYNGAGVDDYSDSGSRFYRIRYWNDRFEMLKAVYNAETGKWEDLAWIPVPLNSDGSQRQVVAYYLQKTDVTADQIVSTYVEDWGPTQTGDPTNLPGGANGYAALDFAVRFESGARVPTLDGYVQKDKTSFFHTQIGWAQRDELVHNQIVEYKDPVSGQTTRLRRTRIAQGRETGEYEIYMVTMRRTSDNCMERLSWDASSAVGAYEYKGTEYVVWLRDDADKERIDFDGLGLETELPADGTMTYTSGLNDRGYIDIDNCYIFEEQGLLITYYVRAKEDISSDSLHVYYRDMNGANTDDSPYGGGPIYDYGIPVHDGTIFDEGFAQDDSNTEYGLTNNFVTNIGNINEPVNSHLDEMPAVPPMYRTGNYILDHVERTDDGKNVILYYRREANKIFVVDFGLKVDIYAEDLNIKNNGDLLVKSIELENAVDGVATGNYGTLTQYGTSYFRYYMNKVMTGPEFFTVVPTYVDNLTGTIVTTEPIQFAIYPATTVYYELSQGLIVQGVLQEGWNFTTAHTGNWLIQDNFSYARVQQTAEVGAEGNYNYGYDYVYEQYGHGTDFIQTTELNSSVDFAFTGTGFELYANCTGNTGTLMAYLYKEDGSLARLFRVDTRNKGGDTDATSFIDKARTYNIPVISIPDELEHGSYTLRVKYVKSKDGDRADGIMLDGVRVTNTMDHAADAIYAQDLEANPTFIELRDLNILKLGVPKSFIAPKDGETGKTGTVGGTNYSQKIYNTVHGFEVEFNTLGQVLNQTPNGGVEAVMVTPNTENDDKVTTDVLDNGPKNEIYLKPGATLMFKVPSDYNIQVGRKELSGSGMVDGFNGNGNRTDMYYKYEADANGCVTITNDTNYYMSITQLKLVPKDQNVATTELALMTIDAPVAKAMLKSVGIRFTSDIDDVQPEETEATEATEATEVTEATEAPEVTEATEAPATEWESGKVYVGGETVTVDGVTYQAKWWTQNEEPGKADVWEVVSTGDEPADETAWNANKVYVGGETVTLNGNTYKAKWWTQGNEPGATDVWELVSGEGIEDGAWNASKVYVGGDTVSYNGSTYQAKWWSMGELPGQSQVWALV